MQAQPTELEVRSCLGDDAMSSASFLNDITKEFKGAISFGPGEPAEALLKLHEPLEALAAFMGKPVPRCAGDGAWEQIAQYSVTNGIINEAISNQLRIDEGIDVRPDAVMVTSGAQEALAIIMNGLFERPRDILLVADPSYPGIIGVARMLDIKIKSVDGSNETLTAKAVERCICEVRGEGRPRALYCIPDFSNPTGSSIPLQERRAILDVCGSYGVFVIEDNPYGMFAYDEPRTQTLKALDGHRGRVVYVGSFAKTLYPGLRVGYLVADQKVRGMSECLARVLSPVKSLISLNTSPIQQAMTAGELIRAGGSLMPIVATKLPTYRARRDAMLSELARKFSNTEGVSWTRPKGGLFVCVKVPFEFGWQQVRTCASQKQVIVCPMIMFCVAARLINEIRLSFSDASEEEIEDGLDRLASFVRQYRRNPVNH
jgi:(S)-3,5-dihydroxyphenylglycine transaminase